MMIAPLLRNCADGFGARGLASGCPNQLDGHFAYGLVFRSCIDDRLLNNTGNHFAAVIFLSHDAIGLETEKCRNSCLRPRFWTAFHAVIRQGVVIITTLPTCHNPGFVASACRRRVNANYDA
jgi:hypothetical protein